LHEASLPHPVERFSGNLRVVSLWHRLCNLAQPHVMLILKRASASRPSGEWKDDDFDVLADGAVVAAS